MKPMQYPRNIFRRKALTAFGRLILPLLAEIKTSGLHRLPRKGPAILAGNHENIVEVVLMAVYSPAIVEFLGTGDVPIDPRFRWLADLYQFIPVKRGNIDRTAIYAALEVLKANGVVGIFPQGGIWGADMKSGRSGVAVLSYLSGAPVYPIGFGGLKGALSKMMHFKRPRLTLRVGDPLQMTTGEHNKSISKNDLDRFSSLVMERIVELLPPEEQKSTRKVQENFDVEVFVRKNGDYSEVKLMLDEQTRLGLGVLFHYPVLLDTFKRNLGLPVGCLQQIGEPILVQEVHEAIGAILDYLERENPGFFTYRFGIDRGILIKNALEVFRLCAEQHLEDRIFVFPIYEYSENGHLIRLRGVDSLHPPA
ncbi:1-acyl-sn-glycerol-3-phosphate acyltransferase [Bellilinea caldifistulae]|nr:1-acyl-sn-glycerol-3-phosphate acyltransferase [Bellilinea caldifistulae]